MKRQWWHDKVAYQIYPMSFYDTNGDGIGDLPGIIEKLDYLKGLGVDIVWLSPIYRSPLADQGYDISDYYNIDPRFGTMEDMDRLLAEAKKREIYIVMDLVVNHCSDEHEWFRKACADPEGEYGKYFYLRKLEKAAPQKETSEGTSAETSADAEYAVTSSDGYVLPCNWRSYFGGPVWEKLPGHEDWFYLHVFHKKQPDLNWENPAVREEIYTMINWWLDRGLAGFRIDAIINIKKELPFRNYAPDRADGLSGIHHMLRRVEGVGEFLGEMRDRTFLPHNAFTVGEVFNEKEEELPLFIGENGYFSTMFDFSEAVWGSSPAGWHANRGITPDAYRSCLFFTQKKTAGIGFISNIIENHDEPRGATRYIPEADRACMDAEMYCTAKKALATVYFFVKGLPWIYQGQELGMENVPLHDIGEVDDISSIDAWKVMRELGISGQDALRAIERNGRDNARTPFQWSAAPGAGFTTGTPWLRIHPNYTEINLEKEVSDPASVWTHYRKMIALRKDPDYLEAFISGDFAPYLEKEHNVIAYLRRTTGTAETDAGSSGGAPSRTILVISNYQLKARTLPLPQPVKKVLLNNCSRPSPRPGSRSVHLSGYQTLVLEV
ncbi:MAG: alpha-glucosidase [Eubacteriales bacterium]|nr:alpha-glucosidase [Eubacteriales bacterium]